VDGMSWSYFDYTIPGKSYGDAWFDSGTGKYYIYLGSGLEGSGTPGGSSVPEPVSSLGVLLGLFVPGFRRVMKRKK